MQCRRWDKWKEDLVLPDMEDKKYSISYCKFAPRCPYATDECRNARPRETYLNETRKGHVLPSPEGLNLLKTDFPFGNNRFWVRLIWKLLNGVCHAAAGIRRFLFLLSAVLRAYRFRAPCGETACCAGPALGNGRRRRQKQSESDCNTSNKPECGIKERAEP